MGRTSDREEMIAHGIIYESFGKGDVCSQTIKGYWEFRYI